MAQQESMSMAEFTERFDTEEKCRDYLYKLRWPNGFVCPKCGAKDEPFQIKCRNQYQCRHCNHQVSVTAQTIMDKTHTALKKWFMAIYMIASDKRGCSALRLKRELKLTYDTAWTISHKIRKAMGDRDGMYLLQGSVEMDEAFFGSPDEGGKRGRGSDKTPVIVGLSFNAYGKPGYIHAKVLDAVTGESVVKFAEETVEKGSIILSDGLPVYNKLASNGYIHQPKNFDPDKEPEHLKWVHVIISNIKAFITGTYHGLGDKHLQAFLDEFCYRFNRRFWQEQLFARTLAACVSSGKYTRHQLIMA